MKLDYKTLIAVSILIFMFSAANYYIFCRLNEWLSLGLGWKFSFFGTLLGCCSFIFIIWHPLPIKFLYHIAAFWFGFIFFAFIVFIAGELLARIIPLKFSYLAIAVLLIAFSISVYSVSNNLSGRKVKFIKLLSSKIKNPIRVVLIADTHISGFHSVEYLAGIVWEINNQDPDIVCISGDFADGRTKFSAIASLNEIKAPIYLVMGNHEIWNNHNSKIEKLLNKTKVKILDKSKYKGIQLVGVHFNNGHHSLKEGLKDITIDTKDYNILLYHEPNEVEVAQAAGIDLMLCGHTHGGQIFPWNYITKLAYKYIKGLYEFKGMLIYVSQGTGVWGPPMRLGSINEITVIDLKPDHIEVRNRFLLNHAV